MSKGVEAIFIVQALVNLATTSDLTLAHVILHELFIVSCVLVASNFINITSFRAPNERVSV